VGSSRCHLACGPLLLLLITLFYTQRSKTVVRGLHGLDLQGAARVGQALEGSDYNGVAVCLSLYAVVHARNLVCVCVCVCECVCMCVCVCGTRRGVRRWHGRGSYTTARIARGSRVPSVQRCPWPAK